MVRFYSGDGEENRKTVLFIITVLCICLSSVTTLVTGSNNQTGYGVMTDDIRPHMSYSGSSQSLFHDRLQLQQNLHSIQVITPNTSGRNDNDNTNTGDRYIVALREGSSSGDRSALIEELKKNALDQTVTPQVVDLYNNVFVGFSISVPKSDTNMLKAIQNNPRVAIAERDQRVQIFAQTLPTGVNRVDGDLSIAKSGNGQGSVEADIAIMDTGIDLNHPDLNVYRERTFVSGTTTADDDNGHGTHVAGIAAAKDNSIGAVGSALQRI